MPLNLPEIKMLFVDLDGVLVDFHSELVKLHGIDPNSLSEDEWAEWDNHGPDRDPRHFWEPLNNVDSEWWANLPKLPWADRLWSACNRFCQDVVILTSTPRNSCSASGKFQWIEKNLGTYQALIGRPKFACAQSGHALIDDRTINLTPWQQYGGIPIALRRPWLKNGYSVDEIIEALESSSSA